MSEEAFYLLFDSTQHVYLICNDSFSLLAALETWIVCSHDG